jgi:iron complex outermembrane receptor protein
VRPALTFVSISLALRAAVAVAEDVRPIVTPPVIAVGADADGPFETTVDSTGFVEVIDAKEVRQGTTTVGELLERSVGVQIQHLGGRDDFSTAVIRGATGGQVKILLDGVSLTRASTSVVNLTDLPVKAIERIEIYRGFVPLRYGSAGAASVINVVTRRAPGTAIDGAVSYGSFNTFEAFASAGHVGERTSTSASLSYRSSDGDFQFEDRGDRVDPSDDRETRRVNNDYESVDVLLRHARRIGPQSSLTLTNSTYYKEEGTPGRGSVQASNARFESLRSILALALDGPGGLRSEVDLTFGDDTQKDPKSIGPGGIIDSLGLPYERAEGTRVAVDGRVSRPLLRSDHHFVEASLETSFDYYEQSFPSSRLSLPTRDQERFRIAMAAGDDITLPWLPISISPQLRYEHLWNDFELDGVIPPLPPGTDSSSSDHSVDPRLGARWDLPWGLTLKGNIGTFFRPPSFQELFGIDGFSASNPGLDAETGVNRDIGFDWRHDRVWLLRDLGFEYAYFHNDIDDIIVLLSSGARIPRAQNVGEARITGHEARFLARAPFGFRLEAGYTHQNAENRSDIVDERGKDLPSMPDDAVHVRLAWERAAWTIAYEVDYRSDVYLDRVQSPAARVPSYTTHDLSLDFALGGGGFHARIEADNLSDEQYEDVLGFPVPGRAFYVTLSYAPGPDAGGK